MPLDYRDGGVGYRDGALSKVVYTVEALQEYMQKCLSEAGGKYNLKEYINRLSLKERKEFVITKDKIIYNIFDYALVFSTDETIIRDLLEYKIFPIGLTWHQEQNIRKNCYMILERENLTNQFNRNIMVGLDFFSHAAAQKIGIISKVVGVHLHFDSANIVESYIDLKNERCLIDLAIDDYTLKLNSEVSSCVIL